MHALSATHPMSKITPIGHKLETDKPKQKQKNGVLENICLHLYTSFGVKIQNTSG